MAEPLALADRRAVLERLEQLADELGQISTWLGFHDEDRSAILLEDAHRCIGAAAWSLEPPLRLRPEGWLSGPGGQQGAAGRWQS